ncbi:hypothetical protein [Acinetobacter junii]|uniref:hypothetical protein n=1 Tax=Acinetobacter junii TaxID=40215 RepID=UPI001BA56134|nr:hypothetical protein [Acinetobacter junii]QUS48743.1 hypothetical protein J5N61_09320 [Acinetobacter junii]
MEQQYKQVKANQKGYWKDRLINEDESFSVPVDEEALWFDDVNPKQADSDGSTNYSRMNKEALTAAAVAKGIELNGSETKAEIVTLLEESDLLQ